MSPATSKPVLSRRTSPPAANSSCAASSSLASQPPTASPRHVQDGAVYTYVGSENIYQPNRCRSHRELRRHADPPARAASGKTVIRPPPSCRTEYISPAASSSSPAAVTIRCATTTTRRRHRFHRRRLQPSLTSPSGCRSMRSPSSRRQPHWQLRRAALAGPAGALLGR